jgi:hypothetical protein
MRNLVVAGVLAILVALPGCSQSAGPKIAPTSIVAGTVLLDGEPMNEDDGEISFAVQGEGPIILPIKAGKFEGKGPVGQARIEIRAFRKGPPVMMDGKPFGNPVKENYIAPEFNEQSKLSEKIEPSGAKSLKFEVQKKK